MAGKHPGRPSEFSLTLDADAVPSPPPVCAAFSQLRAAARARHQIERDSPARCGTVDKSRSASRQHGKLPRSLGAATVPDALLEGESPSLYELGNVQAPVAARAPQTTPSGVHAAPLPARLLGLSAHSITRGETPRATALRLQRMRASAIRSGVAERVAAGRVAALPGCWDGRGRPGDAVPEPHAVRVLEAMRDAQIPSVYRRPSIGPLVSVSRPTPHARTDWLAAASGAASATVTAALVGSSSLSLSPSASTRVASTPTASTPSRTMLGSRRAGSSGGAVRAELAALHAARAAQVAATRDAEAAEIAALQRVILDEAAKIALQQQTVPDRPPLAPSL